MIRILNSIIIFLMASVLISCDSERIYETNENFSQKFWHKDTLKSFSFHITDSTAAYNLYVNLRNTASYPYQNIYIHCQLKDSLNKVLEDQLMSFQLFHSQTGEPFGSSGVGDIFDHQFRFLENYNFPAAGSYQLDLAQMMRKDTLEAILSVGARVEFFQPKN